MRGLEGVRRGSEPAPSAAGAPEVTAPPSAIAGRGLSVSFGGRTVWRALDLDVPAGELVAVLGPNGAGKSTLVKALLGLVPLSAGQLTVLGERPGRRRADIGYLPQRRTFSPGVRIRSLDIVRLGLDGDRWGVPFPWSRRRRQAEDRVARVIQLVGATPYASQPIGQLSGGEQQRLLIAQALVRGPALLLLDEPLDSVDLSNQSSLAALVGSICRNEGVTVVLVAHDVNPILPYLDRVVYLGPGAAVSGPPGEVITAETLSRLFGTPIEVLHTTDGRLVVVGHPEPPAYHADRHG